MINTIIAILANIAKMDPAKVNVTIINFALFMTTNAIFFRGVNYYSQESLITYGSILFFNLMALDF